VKLLKLLVKPLLLLTLLLPKLLRLLLRKLLRLLRLPKPKISILDRGAYAL